MQQCPCCKARLSGDSHCRRCRADLTAVFAAEQAARYWLARAIHNWADNNIEPCLDALNLSLHLKQTPLALVFREFLIDRCSRSLLTLLAQKKLLAAKQQLYNARRLLPYSEFLRQLLAFTDYLLAHNQERS
ncbi:MAG: hypothetical protein CVV13_11655 [Gammaproteobacteria bacterium HGW-Gammaproteobacteria-3]|jgi:hypothetical protein|nr:MAG: hypothetical protein CVV13_11655 [Gammaproteobacteria bacterium HGW-Gammaproteobacteria-3]